MNEKRQQALAGLAVFLLLCGVVWAVFGRVAAAPFFYDDYKGIVENQSIRQLWPLSVPLNPPRDNPFSARPLVNLSAAINYRVGQLDPTGYRNLNMALHAASALLLFLIVFRALTLDRFWFQPRQDSDLTNLVLALAIALMWAVHPLQTESVCYVTQRTELMMGLAYLATLSCSLNFWQAKSGGKRYVWFTLAILACLAGMACKEVMVSAPVVVLLFERTFVAGSFRKALRASWPLYAGLALSWCLLIYLVASAPRSASAGFHLGVAPLTWWFTQCKVLLMYLGLAFWPWPLSIHYEIPYLHGIGEAWPFLVPVALIGVASLVAFWRNWPSGFLGAWFFLILSPTLVVPIVTEVAAERRMYLPLAAVVTFTVVGGYRLASLFARPFSVGATTNFGRMLPAATIVAIALPTAIALGAVSIQRLEVYRDRVTIWRETLARYPHSELAHANLGFALMQIGENREAMEHLAEAIAINPAAFDAHFNLGVLLKKEGKLEEAAKHFGEAVRFNPEDAAFRNDYGYTLLRLRRFQPAVDEFNQALAIEPDMHDARFNLALALTAMGNTTQAITQYNQLLTLNPDDASSHYALGNALLATGQHEQGIVHLQQAVELKPDFADAWNNLGATQLHLGRTQEAIAGLEQAVRVEPDSPVGHANLAEAYKIAGSTSDALAHYRRALELAKAKGLSDLIPQIEAKLSLIEEDSTSVPTPADATPAP